MSGRNRCYITQNDREPLYLNLSLLINQNINYTLMLLKHIYNITL